MGGVPFSKAPSAKAHDIRGLRGIEHRDLRQNAAKWSVWARLFFEDQIERAFKFLPWKMKLGV